MQGDMRLAAMDRLVIDWMYPQAAFERVPGFLDPLQVFVAQG